MSENKGRGGMLRFAAAVLGAVWFIPLSAVAGTPTLSVGSASGDPGTTVNIPVSLAGNTAAVGGQWDITYDSGNLEADEAGASDGSALGSTDHSQSTSEPSAGTARTVIVSLSNAVIPNGELVVIPFDIPAGATPGTYSLALGNETFSDTDGNAVSVALSDGQITVNAPSSGNVQFSSSSYSVRENEGPATIAITRTDGSFGAASVDVSTSDGSATAGSDYTATTQTVNWADGEDGTKTVDVPIIDDSDVEGNETVNLSLSGVSGASLGSPDSATLNIVDDEAAPGPANIPTMSEWAMILMSLMLAGFAVIGIRRQGGNA